MNYLFRFLRGVKNKLVTPFEKEPLTGEVANTMSRYGVQYDFEKIVAIKVKEVENQIYNKLEFSKREKLLNLLVPEDQRDLYDRIKKYFEEKGFKTFYADKSSIKELGENTYLFISWDIKLSNKNK